MALIKKFTPLLLVLILSLLLITAATAAPAPTGKAEMINGTHWANMSPENKLVYLRGLTNWADFIVEAQAKRKNTAEFCMSKVLVDALRTKTLGQIVADVDAYYRDHPGKQGNAVLEAILRGSTDICKPGAGEIKK